MAWLSDVGRRYRLDLLIGLLALEGIAEAFVRQDAAAAPDSTLWFVVPAVVALALTLLARRRYPFGAPVAFWLLAAAFSFVDGEFVPFLLAVFLFGMIASFLLGGLRESHQAWVGLAILFGSLAVILSNKPERPLGQFFFIPTLFGMCWLAGIALHGRQERADAAEERAARAEREREAAARVAVAEERARIARDLHDVVAHAVSVMVLQTGAVRHKLPDELAAEAEALQGVERTGRAALAEMRHLLGAMRNENDAPELLPQPGLDRLEALAADLEGAGLPVRIHVEGESFRLPPAIDLSAYRIVQEGLTNALKHARASHADVTVRYGPRDVAIEVRDDGPGGASGNGQGHGLVGIRERVKIYGGEMTAGPSEDGGYVLTARLPVGEVVR